MFRTLFKALVIPVAAGAAALAVAVPASASTVQAQPNPATAGPYHLSSDVIGATGRCGYDLCLYYNSYEQGAVIGINNADANLQGLDFPPTGNGAGTPVKNGAASAENQGSEDANIYYNSNFSGACDFLTAGSYGQLYYTYNQDASVNFGI